MNNISANTGVAGFQSTQSRSISAQEALNAGVTIQTREGDVVTLNAASFSEFNSSEYNSQGVVANGNSLVASSSNLREITLSTGESFSFSVQGDLSEEELKDIEAIIKGVDDIIGEMTQGDMTGAVAEAVELTTQNFGTVAAYSADLSYQRSYSMTQTETSQAYSAMPAGDQGRNKGLVDMADVQAPTARDTGLGLLEKMMEQLKAQKEELLEKARNPLDSLFEKYKTDAREARNPLAEKDLSALQGETASLIQGMVQDAFGKALDQFV